MPIIPGLGDRLREARRKSGFSLEGLAQKAGTNRRSLYSYEKGLVDPKVGDLKSITDALNVSVCSIILGELSEEILNDRENVKSVIVAQLKLLTKDDWTEILKAQDSDDRNQPPT